MKIRLKKKNIHLYIIIFGGILLFFMGIMNHYFFRTVTYDYGIYNFAFWDYSHFRISSMPVYPGNFLQDHFSFTLMYFIPFLWLLNWLTGTYTLIIIQYSLVLIAAWYTYLIIKSKTNNYWLGVGVLVYYFVLLGRFTTFSCDVNLAVLSACFIPVFLCYFEQKKYLTSFILFILALLSRENIPLWFIFIFIVLAIQHRKDKKAVWLSVAGILISIIYFAALFKIFIPAIETEEKQFTLFNYSALGSNPGEALNFAFRNPIETIKLFFVNHLDDPALNNVKTEFYIVYLVSGGIILLLRPQYFIWFIPIVAQKMFNDSFVRWGISTYYSIEVVTLLPVSVFLTIASLKSRKLQNGIALVVCIATLSMTIHKLDYVNVEIPWTLNPSKEKFYYKRFYESHYNLKKTHKLLKTIPLKAKVSASDHLLPHLAQRQTIYLFPDVKDAEYLVFSVFDNHFLYPHIENEKIRNKYFTDPEWEIIGIEFPVFILKRKDVKTSSNFEVLNLEFQKDTIICDYERIDSLNNQVLFNDKTIAEIPNRLTRIISRSGDYSLQLDQQNREGYKIRFDNINQIKYIRVAVWFSTEGNGQNIVASCGSSFFFINNAPTTDETDGWKKLEMSIWIPDKPDKKDFTVFLLNYGDEPAYFDDLKIVKYLVKE